MYRIFRIYAVCKDIVTCFPYVNNKVLANNGLINELSSSETNLHSLQYVLGNLILLHQHTFFRYDVFWYYLDYIPCCWYLTIFFQRCEFQMSFFYGYLKIQDISYIAILISIFSIISHNGSWMFNELHVLSCLK